MATMGGKLDSALPKKQVVSAGTYGLCEWESLEGFSECPEAFQYYFVNLEDKTLN